MSDAPKRPQFRNIHVTDIAGYRLPLAALVSILHRISGAFLFLLLPFILYLLQQSLYTESTFIDLQVMVSPWYIKLIILAISWSFLHHFCAGVRHLLMDVHVGIDKDGSRASATGVLAVSLVLAALVALKLLGVF
jgi:succinate dehydrogenase / fumarate reductase cytochrome b subunit